ncbi:hypothetical protein PAERUG_E15_London_28_01_14_06834 [Pseudomonas aeruginosa]|nr:hypothetical protein PAERUG_E15_London_28_01_14_06834 [Pseudomonas aeruginosa]
MAVGRIGLVDHLVRQVVPGRFRTGVCNDGGCRRGFVDDLLRQVIPGRLAFGNRFSRRTLPSATGSGSALEGRFQCCVVPALRGGDGFCFVDHLGGQVIPGGFARGWCGALEGGFQRSAVPARRGGDGFGFVDHFGRQVVPGRFAFGDCFDRRALPGACVRQHGRRRRDHRFAQQFVQVIVEDAGAVHAACSRARASSPRIQFKARR